MNTTKQKVLCVTGALLIDFMARPPLIWGNLYVYVLSYYVFKHGDPGPLTNSMWFGATFCVGWTMAMLTNEALMRRVQTKYIVLVGLLLLNSFFFVSAFAGNVSWTCYLLLSSTLAGSGVGMFSCIVLNNYVLGWGAESKGMLVALPATAASLGAAIGNQFITWWINPGNQVPDIRLGKIALFSQEEIINRVPSMFLTLGGINAFLQFIGFYLLIKNDPHRLQNVEDPENYYSSRKCKSCDLETENKEEIQVDTGSSVSEHTEATSLYRSLDESDDTFIEYICNRDFLKLFFIYFAFEQCMYISVVNYKEYGALWIKNDHFFSYIGTTMSLPPIFTMLITGMVIDRFGLKSCYMAMSSVLCLLTLLMYFSPMIHPIVYFLVIVTMVTISTGVYTCNVAYLVIMFGQKHLSRNLALLTTSCVVAIATVSYIAELLANDYGWFGVFAWTAVFALAAFILVTVTFPESQTLHSRPS